MKNSFTKRKPLLFLSMFLLLFCGAFVTSFSAPPPDSCLKMVLSNDFHFDSTGISQGSHNPDSVMIDTCSGSPTFGHLFTKRWFAISFPPNFYPFDHQLDSGEVKGVSDIDSAHLDLLNRFLGLQDTFGLIFFQGLQFPPSDSILMLGPSIRFYFDEYQDGEFIAEHFTTTIDSVRKVAFQMRAATPTIIPNDKGMKANNSIGEIQVLYPDHVYRNYRPNGFQSYMYNINAPMAWELTYGSSDVCIDFEEFWNMDIEMSHPDVVPNLVNKPNKGDAFFPQMMTLKTGHGLYVMSCAIAQNGNDYPLVGSAPQCKGIATDISGNDPTSEIDIDGVVNGYIKFPDIRNMSYEQTGTYYSKDIDAGIVCVANTGNTRGMDLKRIRPDGVYPNEPSKRWPGASTFIDPAYPANPAKDYKVICVGGTDVGDFLDRNCNPWNDYTSPANSMVYSDNFQFWTYHNFSPGTQKFDKSSNIFDRKDAKEQAMTDIVAPAVVTAADGEMHDGFFPGWRNDRKYDINISGVSNATAIVSGITGLMLSANKFMGVPLDGNSKPINGKDVQRKAYDILTFTAKKIPDFQNFSTDIQTDILSSMKSFNSDENLDGSKIQYNYKTQWNDNLKRSWAQRMGFGLVDAYRAVAHSIMQKGAYEYNLSGSTSLTFNADNAGDARGYTLPAANGTPYGGRKAMHFGSKVKEGTGDFEMPLFRGPSTGNDGELNVLEWGGVSLPGEFHNNQGVTKITSTNLAQNYLEVPPGCILAIDGIIFSDQPQYNHYIRTSSTNSSIIEMEGMIKDIELHGNLRIGDVILDGSIDNGVAAESGCIGFGKRDPTSGPSEIYGNVNVINKGFIYANGEVVMQPGASVNLNGEKDFHLKGGWTAMGIFRKDVMQHNTKITSTTGRKVTVEDGVTLYIDVDAVATFDCELNIKNHGSVILVGGSVAKVKYLNVEPGGSIIIDTNATLVLSNEKQICNGILTINALSTKKANIVGQLAKTCLPTDFDYPTYSDHQFIQTQPVIYMKGDCADADLQKLTLKNAVLKDVSINGSNIRINGAIDECEFYSKTSTTNPGFKFDYLLSLYYNNCQVCENSDFHDVLITDCKFEDLSLPVPAPNSNNDINKTIYNTGGVIIEGYTNAFLNNNNFTNLEFGINTFDCGNVRVGFSSFDFCGIGDYDFGSTTFLCSNTYDLVKFGSIRDRSLTGKTLDNMYTRSKISFSAISSLEQRLRDNIFNEYVIGILASCTPIRMSDIVESGHGVVYGRNEFIHLGESGYPNSHNSYLSKACEWNFCTDISISNSCCSLFMDCGHNSMSVGAHFNLLYTGLGTFSPNVAHNYFPPSIIPPTMAHVRRNATCLAYAPPIPPSLAPPITAIEDWTALDEHCCGDILINQATTSCAVHDDGYYESCPANEPNFIKNSDNQLKIANFYDITNHNVMVDLLQKNEFMQVYRSVIEGSNKLENLAKLSEAIEVNAELSKEFPDLEVYKLLIDLKLKKEVNLSNYNTAIISQPNIQRILHSINSDNATPSSLLSYSISMIDFQCENSTGVNDEENNGAASTGITIEPNPSAGTFRISGLSSVLSMRVFNMLGVEISSQSVSGNKAVIEGADFANGVYFVQFHTQKGLITKPIVVSH
ncbi:MAG: T9SS type A sorting domain-containing protein [Ignavibacteriae bacterium]|nr:T9SS type A sorting domain-containing protein [Ignavibacteriota bacterium]